MRKVDVVITYYRQAEHWGKVLSGLEANARYINNVIVVNDEPWTETPHNPTGIPMKFYDHEHNGFGVCKSYNQGLDLATTEYVFVMPADVLIPPRHIARMLMLATGVCLVGGPVNHVQLHSTLTDLKLIREDRFAHLASDPDARPWHYIRGANRLIHRQGHWAMGGFDDRFDEFNYEDTDYTARWVTKHGYASVKYAHDAPVFHLGDPYHEPRPCDKSRDLLFKSIHDAEQLRLMSMDSWIVDFDDLCDATAGSLAILRAVKEAVPGFKVTLFTIPVRTSQRTLDRVRELNGSKPWIQLAPHGWRHTRGECLAWTQEEAVEKITRAQAQFGDLCAPLFKAPAWLLDAETYKACNALGITVYNPGHLGITNYVHGHLSHTTGNHISDMITDGRMVTEDSKPFYYPQEVL